MSVEVINESDFTNLDEVEFVDLAKYVYEQLKVDRLADMSIVFNTEDQMEVLHLQWLGLPGSTDVMSFPIDELRPGQFYSSDDDSPTLCLGDVAICPAVATKQAEGTGHSAHEEMMLLCVHGILHLLGYDHVKAIEKQEMFDLQRKLLLGYIARRDSLKLEQVDIIGLPV